MTRYITANGEDVEIVEETRNGDRYYVATGVPIVKPMDLATGYVPREWIAASTEMENTHGGTGWDGTTPTVNHPRNRSEFSWHDPDRPEDDIVLAANEDVQETLGVGTVENDRFDGEYVRADIAINADEAREMGGEAADIVDDVEAGRGLEVSSQYLHAELPPGEYDGSYREDAKAIAAPDSVALIPNGRGVCSVVDGCGIAPGVAANVADYPDVGAISAGTDDPVSPQTGQGEGQRTMDNGSQMAGVRQLFSGIASLVGSAAGPTDGTTKSQTADTPDDDPRGGDGEAGEQNSNEPAESGADTTGNSTMKDDKREELIRFITANSELNEDSLEHMGDTCLKNTHEMVVANAANDGSDGPDADGGDDDDGTDDDDVSDADGGDGEGDGVDNTDDGLDAVMNRLDDLEDRMVTEDSIDQHVETAANQLEAEERAKKIVANSDEYDEDDVDWIAGLPEKELERKERGATQSGGLPAAGSPSFGATGNEDSVDGDDMPDLEVN
ncbi:hypothetical protein [Natrialba sp. SSL1]|uniref:hypothetical protein n=1 Tax=Natrialba sp. SSL1 TaxID=1869245 RepID=UPI0008F94D2A|nr:hypothetical protein [Natrialba sp. SSL1]OIB56609.1 hypothetical protein BBD46_16605 [Natrialba sp. SSL1]